MSDDAKIKALAKHLNVNVDTIADEGHDTYTCSESPGEYLVLTDSEADERWNAYLDDYLDECVLGELPEIARNYFDRDAWKRDAKFDGRGHSLSSYDGAEHEAKIDGEWIYIYRVN